MDETGLGMMEAGAVAAVAARVESHEPPPAIGYCPLSEARVVRLLIVYRSKLDAAGGMVALSGAMDNTMMTSGTPVINEDILCLYLDLDRLIESASLSPLQETVVTEVMKGYSITDIAEELTVSKQLIATSLSRAAEKIA